jgi:ankyrin repeat protein
VTKPEQKPTPKPKPSKKAIAQALGTALREAVERSDLDGARKLLDQGAPTAEALVQASMFGFLPAVELLLARGADPNAGDGTEQPLHRVGDADVARALIKAGANVNAQGRSDKDRPLHNQFLRPELARVLIEAGADVNVRAERRVTPLHEAILYGRPPEVIRLLLEAGADPSANADNLSTPLRLIIDSNRTEWREEDAPAICRLLLRAGAEVDGLESGNNLLHDAFGYDAHPEIVEMLLQAGVDPDQEDAKGKTARQMAAAVKGPHAARIRAAFATRGADAPKGAPAASRAVGSTAAAAYEARIEAAPDDIKAWRRYGQWLKEKGDPCGELIELELALGSARGDARRKHEKARKELLARHAGYWFGPVVAYAKDNDEIRVRSRFGFVDSARLAFENSTFDSTEDADPKNDVPGPRLPPVPVWLRELRASPLARFIRELTFGQMRVYGRGDFGPLIKELVADGGIPTLETLWLGDFDDAQTFSHVEPGDLAPLFDISPRLRRLAVDGARPKLAAPVAHAALEELALHTMDLPKATAAALARSRFPRLDRLELSFRSDSGIGSSVKFGIDTLAPLFEGKSVPKLRHLSLTMSAFGNDLVEALLGSKLLPRLETLDIGFNLIDGDGAARLAAQAKKLSHLRSIDLRHNTIEKAAEKTLRAALGRRVTPREPLFGDPDEQPHWRAHGKWLDPGE